MTRWLEPGHEFWHRRRQSVRRPSAAPVQRCGHEARNLVHDAVGAKCSVPTVPTNVSHRAKSGRPEASPGSNYRGPHSSSQLDIRHVLRQPSPTFVPVAARNAPGASKESGLQTEFAPTPDASSLFPLGIVDADQGRRRRKGHRSQPDTEPSLTTARATRTHRRSEPDNRLGKSTDATDSVAHSMSVGMPRDQHR